MLWKYQLTNFKAFRETALLPIRPITLIYGPNSSGKSSILQSLLLLKQTLEEAESTDVRLLPKGKLTNLGNYREFVHRHDVNQPFAIKVIFKGEDSPNLGLRIAFAYDQQNFSSTLLIFWWKWYCKIQIDQPLKAEVLDLWFVSLAYHLVSGRAFSSFDLFQDREDIPIVTYREKRVGDNVVLTVDNVYSEHPFWQNWWKDAQPKLLDLFRHQTNDAIKAWQQLKSIPANQKKRIADALAKQIAPLKQELEQIEESQRSQTPLADCIDEMEYLIELDQRLKTYTLAQAIEDFLKITSYSFIEYRNFLPDNPGEWKEEFISFEEFFPLEDIHLFKLHQRLGTFEALSKLTVEVSNLLRVFLGDIIYIAPLRDYPERLYIFSGNTSEQVGKTGKGISDLLFKRPDLLERVNQRLTDFDLKYELKVEKFKSQDTDQLSDIFALRLVDQFTDVNVSLLDVGFGISQVLPIIIQSMASSGKIIMIEQPEIHIHPRLQTELGSLLAECIKEPFYNEFIIETHSEHLMLRLQKLIRKGELEVEDVSVIYVDRTPKGAKCKLLRLNEEGYFIDEWPDGFFEEGYKERFS